MDERERFDKFVSKLMKSEAKLKQKIENAKRLQWNRMKNMEGIYIDEFRYW